jgi:hypothetical protein
MTKLIQKVANEIGFPFGIRGTAKKYHRPSGTVPSGTSDSEGLDFEEPSDKLYSCGQSRLHFFVVDQKAVESFPQQNLDWILKNSIKKAVTEYSRSHSGGYFLNFLKGPEKDAMPVLYLFNPGQMYCRDRYNGSFSELNGAPTFPEADADEDKLILPRGIFLIDEKDYTELEPRVRAATRASIPAIEEDYGEDDIGEYYFQDQDVEKDHRFFEGMHEYQEHLNGAIPRGYKFEMPSKKEIEQSLQDKESYLTAFNKAYLMNGIANEYLRRLYDNFSEKIISDIENRFE